MTRISPVRAGLALLMLLLVVWLGWTGGPANAFDQAAIRRLTDFRLQSPSLSATAIALTWLGSAYVTLGGTLAAALVRAVQRNWHGAAWLVATVAGGRMLADGIKLAVDRPRPHLTPYPVPVSSFSFPSGHATNSMLAFGALALAFTPRGMRLPIVAAVSLSVLVGLTRPLLGVHWPSDVLAGWMLGGATLLLASPLRPSAARTAA